MNLPNLPFTDALKALGQGKLPDAGALQRGISDALNAAGLDPSRGPMKNVTETIQRALESAGLATPGASTGSAASTPSSASGASSAPMPCASKAADDAEVIDVEARDVTARDVTARDVTARDEDGVESRPACASPGGTTISGSHSGAAGSRSYELHVPPGLAAKPVPLVVMLHGCTQSPADFAAGTRMNELADRHGFLVVYPAQSANANGSKCWNWYRAQDQSRDGGEPALIAGIVRDVMQAHSVDPKRVFVAGLSAGGAMAVILGQTYPELFAGVGVHSGLPYAAAHDMASAFAAMSTDPRGNQAPHGKGEAASAFVPTIVFHGDRDHTVNAGNGAEVAAQALARARDARSGKPALSVAVHPGGTKGAAGDAAGDRGRYTRTVHTEVDGRPLVEQWVLHGAGHAWSGGSASGSFTDPSGPNASEAMLRFFLAQSRAK